MQISKLSANYQKLDVALQSVCKECQNSYIETLQRQERQQHNINNNNNNNNNDNNFVETIAIKTVRLLMNFSYSALPSFLIINFKY